MQEKETTMTDPVKSKPTTTFAAAMEANAPAADGPINTFRIALSSGGVQLGWVGHNDSGWGILVSDVSKALTFEVFRPDPDETFYRIQPGNGSFMCASDNAYVGFYPLVGDNGAWRMSDSHLIAKINNQPLSYYSKENAYLYCWDKYTVLDVSLQNV
jgi:hypothetical protein